MHSAIPLTYMPHVAPPADVVRHVVSPRGNVGSEIQELADYLRDECNGGVVELIGTGLYDIRQHLTIDTGSGVSLHGNGATLDVTSLGLEAGAALTCASRRPAKVRKSGFDANNGNYHQWRAEVSGVALIGLRAAQVTDASTILGDGILIDQNPAVSTRSPRTILRGVATEGFRHGYVHRNFAYLTVAFGLSIGDAIRGMVFEGGNDQGENSQFYGVAVFNCNEGLVFDSGTDNFNATFAGLSCDYNGQQLIYRSGNGRVTFLPGCYWEFNGGQVRNPIITGSLGDAPPFDFRIDAGNTSMWVFDGNEFNRQNLAPGFDALFEYGNNHIISADDCFGQWMSGKGVQMGVGKGASGADTVALVMAHRRSGAAGDFSARRWRSWTVSDWNAVSTIDSRHNLLANGSFSSTTMLDNWYGTAGQIGALSINSASVHVGANALVVPITGGAAVSKSLSVLVPADRIDRLGVLMFLKLDAGSGQVKLRLRNVICTSAITPGTEPTTREPQSFVEHPLVNIDSAHWTPLAQTQNAQRFRVEPWATHIRVNVDLTALAAGTLRAADATIGAQ